MPFERIVIIGCSGSGKSTLAQSLGRRAGLPVTHLDRLHWRPGWVEGDKAEFQSRLDAVLATDRWIIDGNYLRTLPSRLEKADTVIFFDFPRLACLRGAVGRFLQHRGRTRPDMTPGCNEKIDWEFVQWIWTFNKKVRPKLLSALSSFSGRQVILRSRKEANAFLASWP